MKNALKTSTFKSRFQAIHNFRFKHTQTAHLLFKVYGLNLKANEVITHKGIKIISSKSNKFKNIRKQEEGFVFNYFENEEKFCIAVLKKTYRSEGFAIKSSLDELNFYIDKINRTTSYFLLVDSNDMFITKDFKEYHGTTRLGEITKAKQYDESEFKKLDFDISDFNLSDEVKEIFLRHQNINDVAVVYKRNPEFWIYLEALHKELIENCDYNKTIKSITSILKSTYYDRLMYRIRFTIWAGLFNNRKIYGFDMTDYNKNRYFESIDVELVKEKTISKFVKDFVSDLTKQPHQLDIESVERFYKNLFLELYELRNHYFHTGNTIRNLEIKMTYTIKYFIDLYIQNILNYSHESKIISPIDQFKSINSNVEKENRKYEN
jgi:hypothetical protein